MASALHAKNDWLQALRAVAALMVLFFHLTPHWALSPTLAGTGVFTRWGFAGVDIFFVLSGYVVYQAASRRPFEIKPFMARRAARIYLGYWPVLALLIAGPLFATPYPDLPKMLTSVALLNPVLWDNWLPTAWSLTYELYFYLWIALIFAWRRLSPGTGLALLASVLVLWNAGWYLWDMPAVAQGRHALPFVLTPLGLEFLAGAACAHLRMHCQAPMQHPGWMLALGGVLIVAGFSIGTQKFEWVNFDFIRAGIYGSAGLGFVLLALALHDLQWPAPRALVALGDASYSLYLLHPVLLNVGGVLRTPAVAANPMALLLFSLAMPVVICLAALWWFRCIEKPLFQRGTSALRLLTAPGPTKTLP